MQKPRAALFDLDDTLAESFKLPKPEMIDRILSVLDYIPVAIITGRGLDQMKADFMRVVFESSHIEKFYLFPEGAAECLNWDGQRWQELYTTELLEEERVVIRRAIAESVDEARTLDGLPVFGERYIDKHAMIAYAILGIGVPSDIKYSWDPGNMRRSALRAVLSKKLPQYDVLMGGATSIDVTKKGVNKAYGVRWLEKHLNIPAKEMLYVGDALFPDGNDYVVIPTGIQTISTSGPDETEKIIDELLMTLRS
jgi:phosphomannomutase